MPPERYTDLLKQEIRQRAGDVPVSAVDTVYFGGGTPSLFEPSLILAILDELAKAGFRRTPNAEVTIEIDPATCDQRKLDSYLEMGINRFSVGAQSFNDRLLKMAGRKHSSQDTVETLTLLKRNNVNYSFDLLFALPSQTLEEVRADVATALAFDPAHLSAYCLTVPEGHRLSIGRAPEDDQVEMFHVIEDTLKDAGIHRYEISNFARPGYESRHNMLYWTDEPYWGLGLSSHSYFPAGFVTARQFENPWGFRFWNTRALKKFEDEINMSQSVRAWRFEQNLPADQFEILRKHQALTDYCHTSLRLTRGMDKNALRLKFGAAVECRVESAMNELKSSKMVDETATGWSLSTEGRLVANAVFEKLTFLEGEAGPD